MEERCRAPICGDYILKPRPSFNNSQLRLHGGRTTASVATTTPPPPRPAADVRPSLRRRECRRDDAAHFWEVKVRLIGMLPERSGPPPHVSELAPHGSLWQIRGKSFGGSFVLLAWITACRASARQGSLCTGNQR